MTDENETVNTINTKVIFALSVYCASGTLLTLANKLAIVAFPYANMLLVLQNGTTVFFLVLGSYFMRDTIGPIPLIDLTIIIIWTPLVLLFVLMLTSSLFALIYASVPTVIVMRSLSTLFVALLEYIVLGTKINGVSIATLVGMCVGAALYAKHDLTFNIHGYTWLFVNTVSTSIYQIYTKKIINIPLTKDIGASGMSYYNNLISLPVLFILACAMGELKMLSSNFSLLSFLKMRSIGVVLLSCILGLSLSISAFTLNKLISATSLMVANNANKFSLVLVNEIFVQSTLDITGYIGAIFVLFLGWLYSQATKRFSKSLFFLSITFFLVLGTVSEYKHISIAISGASSNSTSIINEHKADGEQIYKSYLPSSTLSQFSRHKSVGVLVKKTTEFQLPNICLNKNSSVWRICNAARCIPNVSQLKWDYPRTTATGENTGEFINRVLKVAWGSNPPSVDLYLRSGCNGLMEMKYLLESIEIFWPRFLGSIIIVLDAGDEVILKYLLPANPTHHYVIGFERPPCFPGRVFNQYSYLNIDRHSSANYVVTIDSDCIFHSPVTPDLIFRQGKVLLASSHTFQGTYWVGSIDAMMGAGMYDGHYMVTQPVTFALSTFSSFRQWFHKSKGICYEDHLAQLSSQYYPNFCWMCQLGTYLERGHPIQSEYNQYWYQHLDNSSLDPLLRYAIHVTYEPYSSTVCGNPKCYEQSANEVIKQGLCRAFDSSIFHICANYSDLAYINKVTFLYAHTDIQSANRSTRANALSNYLKRLYNATKITLGRPTKSAPRL